MTKLDVIEEALRKLCYVDLSHEQADQCLESIFTALAELRQERERMRNVLGEARQTIGQLLDDLSAGSMTFHGHGVCKQAWDEAVEALKKIDECLKGESNGSNDKRI